MRLVVGSCFRNSASRGQLTTFFRQLDALRELCKTLGYTVRLIAVEGDSSDDTRQQLWTHAEALPVHMTVVTREHGLPWFGSTEEPARFKALAYVGNGVMESVHESDDVLIYVESDLLWRAETIMQLVAQVRPGVDVIAPLVFAGMAFYDIWAFRKNGHRFGPFSPYHGEIDLNGVTQIDSAGSCLVMRAEVARTCRIPDDCLVGFCREAWAHGFTVQVDARERIYHP